MIEETCLNFLQYTDYLWIQLLSAVFLDLLYNEL